MRKSRSFILLLSAILYLTSCVTKDEPACDGVLFGKPVAATGLSYARCNPECKCKGFKSREFSAAEVSALKAWRLTIPFAELSSNPYDQPAPETEPCLCGVVVEDEAEKTYRLETFSDEDAAAAAGAIVTHYDACGLCSTLPDFAVYVEKRDIGAQVRACGIRNFGQPFEVLVGCIESLGFTRPCAQIWAYNLRHTQANCLNVCANDDPYHLQDGSLSPCLECDEIISGPVFKAVAGRTRRNTGLASSICRPCNEVQPIEHNYPF